jgi:hypothetical protein
MEQNNSNHLEAYFAHIGINDSVISEDDNNSHLEASLAHIGIKDTATSNIEQKTNRPL